MKKLLIALLAAVFLFSIQSVAQAATPVSKSKYYARSTLSGGELSYYDALYAAMPKRAPVEANKFGVLPNRSKQILRYMYNDAPEILGYYIVLGMQQNEPITSQISQKTAQAMAKLNANMTEADKARALYLYLGETITYIAQDEDAYTGSLVSEQATDSSTIVGGLISSLATSRGIARTYQYLLQQAGIPCYTVTGTAIGQPHAWDMLQLGGEWYFADLGLDIDAIKTGAEPRYFLLDHSIFADHAVNQDENPPLPAASSKKYMAQSASAASASKSAGSSADAKAAAQTVIPAAAIASSPAPSPTQRVHADDSADFNYTSVLVAIMIGLVVVLILLNAKKRKNSGSDLDE